MKNFSLIIAIFAFLMVVSCQNDTTPPSVEPVNEPIENEVVNSTQPADSIVVSNELSDNDSEEVTDANTSIQLSHQKVNAKAKIENKEEKLAVDKEQTIKTAEDLSGELNNEVNRQANPDNYNGVAEIDSKSDVKLVPVFTDAELNNYFVQVAIKVRKMSKSELGQIFPSTETIYIVQHEGLYKYCMGKFESEAEAVAYKKQIDKKYNFQDTQVVTFKQAW